MKKTIGVFFRNGMWEAICKETFPSVKARTPEKAEMLLQKILSDD